MYKYYNLGDWITSGGNILQIIYIRPCYVEMFSQEYYEGHKVGAYLYDIFICKILCDINGNIKKSKRITIVNSEYCNLASSNYVDIINNIKQNNKEAYREYITYDEKSDLGESLALKIKVEKDDLIKIDKEIIKINSLLKNAFTMKEFLKIAKDNNFSIDINNALKNGPEISPNLSIVFFNRLYKVVNKQYIYSKVWCDY